MPVDKAVAFFSEVPQAAPDAIFDLKRRYAEDEHPQKIDAGVGAYRTDDSEPYVLSVVADVEKALVDDKTLNHEYLPIGGMRSFSMAAARLAFGADNEVIVQNRIAAVQTLSGTGALRLAIEFIKRFIDNPVVYFSSPTWGNHTNIAKTAGIADVRQYRYYKPDSRSLDRDGLLEDLSSAPRGSVVVLHSCAHNPTGVDPSHADWDAIADVCRDRQLLPLFDLAYQGFASGDPDTDAWAVRRFVERKFEIFVAQSFAKIFGLYDERVGNLFFACSPVTSPSAIESQLKLIVRPMYSNPPSRGARIVGTILNNPVYYARWLDELKMMAARIQSMRELLHSKLKSLGTPGDWSHILNQSGMFTFTGLNAHQVGILEHKYHFYMLKNGRINMCGLTTKNIDRVAKAFYEVVVGEAANL